MKKTQLLEVLRLILSTKTFCLTMVLVTALGIVAYTGISFATLSLKESCEAYYDKKAFYDIQIGSVYGFSEETVKALKENEGVSEAEAVYTTQELVTINRETYVAEIYTQPDTLNQPTLVSGRLPEKDGECAAEQALLDRFDLRVGDIITLPSSSEMLRSNEYLIVGSVDLVTVFATNDFYNRGTSDLGDGQVTTKLMVHEDAFTDDALRQLCYITVTDRGDRGSDEYLSYVQQVRDELMVIVERAGQEEYDKRRSEYQEELDDAEAEYNQSKEDMNEAEDKLTDAQQELSDARQEIADARQELADGTTGLEEAEKNINTYERKLSSGRETLDETKIQLQSAKQQLEEGKQQLEDVQFQLEEAREQLDSGKAELDSAATKLNTQKSLLNFYSEQLGSAQQSLNELKNQLDENQRQLSDLQSTLAELDPESAEYQQVKAQCDQLQQVCDTMQARYDSLNAYYQQSVAEYEAAQSAYDSAYAQYQESCDDYEEGEESYSAAEAEYLENKSVYESKLSDYNSAYDSYAQAEEEYTSQKHQLDEYKREYAKKQAELVSGKEELSDAERELDENSRKLDDKKSELEENNGKLTDAGNKIEEAKDDLDKMPVSQSFSSDINANPSYYYYTQTANGTDTIVATVCTLLMGVAILICFTTISRMVTEHHRIIGAQKAMGFLPYEIYGKYIIYAVICTLCGIVLGVTVSYFFMERLVYQMVYGSAFILQEFKPIINWTDTLMISALEIGLMGFSAFLACRSMLKKRAIDLLNSNIRSNKGLNSKRESHLPLRVEIVLRNVRSNPQVFITTLVSVMACTILMISTFTVHYAMSGIAPRQFGELQHYQGTLTLNKDAEDQELDEMKSFLDQESRVQILPVMEKFTSYKAGDSVQYATLIGIDPTEDISGFIEILDADTLESMEIPEKGVLICKKMAENDGYAVGDDLILFNNMGKEYSTFVAGIFDRNIGMAIILSPDYYAELMETETEVFQYYIKGDTEDILQFCEEAKAYGAYCNYSDAKYYMAEMEYKVGCVNKLILVMLVNTGFLSLFVLYNLSQMNIRKIEKDIMVMKALGFPRGRIRGYVFWEAMIMCTIGLILGIIIGGPLGSYLTKAVELSNLQDIRGISPGSCVQGAAINLIFYTVTNLFSLIGIRKIKMTGSAREA